MNIKKILILTIIVLAVFSCLSVANAGVFDFLGGDAQQNATYKFDGFTLDFAKDAEFANTTTKLPTGEAKIYAAKYEPNGKDSKVIVIEALSGEGFSKSIDEFKNTWIADGAKDMGSYNNWTILDFQSMSKSTIDSYGIDLNTTSYGMAIHSGSKVIVIEGNDLEEMKKVADTFKEIKD